MGALQIPHQDLPSHKKSLIPPLFQPCSAQSDTSGLSDAFQPSVKASCIGGTMKIRVDTREPFEGIIHSPNRSEPGCSVVGQGRKKTILLIDLTKTNGETGACGVRYNRVSN